MTIYWKSCATDWVTLHENCPTRKSTKYDNS